MVRRRSVARKAVRRNALKAARKPEFCGYLTGTRQPRIPLVIRPGGCFISPAMKPVLCLLPAVVLVSACDSNDKEAAASKPPKAIVVEEEPAAEVTTPAPAPRAILIAEPEVADSWETRAPRALPVPEEELEAVSQPRPASARVALRLGEDLQTAGEKSKEAAIVAEEHSREAVDVAREKTETGLRKAAESTGRFLQRAGEKIEDAAKESAEP